MRKIETLLVLILLSPWVRAAPLHTYDSTQIFHHRVYRLGYESCIEKFTMRMQPLGLRFDRDYYAGTSIKGSQHRYYFNAWMVKQGKLTRIGVSCMTVNEGRRVIRLIASVGAHYELRPEGKGIALIADN